VDVFAKGGVLTKFSNRELSRAYSSAQRGEGQRKAEGHSKGEGVGVRIFWPPLGEQRAISFQGRTQILCRKRRRGSKRNHPREKNMKSYCNSKAKTAQIYIKRRGGENIYASEEGVVTLK